MLIVTRSVARVYAKLGSEHSRSMKASFALYLEPDPIERGTVIYNKSVRTFVIVFCLAAGSVPGLMILIMDCPFI